jgi:predicted TIM-barrel fold metal-dependent hydrolase
MITDLIMDGVCERFPSLDFVSVESGFGWIPFLVEGLDWQWRNYDGPRVNGGLLPSEYFRRQIYGCFWFEEASARSAIEQFPDNILYETDYPHPTCQHPGPRTPAQRPRDYATRVLGSLDDATLAKVLHDNAAALYGLD